MLFSVFVARNFFSGNVPGSILLWSLAIVIMASQLISMVYDGMTPLNFPAVAMGFLYSIFLIKSLLGHFILGNAFFYALPLLVVFLIIQVAVG